jgi:hypothetical protein
MDKSAILCKTRKGMDELANRTGAIPQKLRSMLILADGKTSYSDLIQKCSFLPQCIEHLDWLVQNEFISLSPVSPGQVRADAPPAAKAAPAPHTESLKTALVNLAKELLGTHAGTVVQRLQDTDDARDALTQTLERCHKLIRLSIDEKKAEQFRMRGMALLEAAPQPA